MALSAWYLGGKTRTWTINEEPPKDMHCPHDKTLRGRGYQRQRGKGNKAPAAGFDVAVGRTYTEISQPAPLNSYYRNS